jgi:hypothetical protein
MTNTDMYLMTVTPYKLFIFNLPTKFLVTVLDLRHHTAPAVIKCLEINSMREK